MIQICYSEMDGPHGPTCRLEAAGHAGYAPAGQDIVCAGASLMMQSLAALLAGQADAKSDAWDEPEGPRLAVSAAAPQEPWVEGAFELAKQSAALLAERYPDHVKFADTSRRAKQGMVDLQLFAEQAAPDAAPPALSRTQAQQAAASGTLKRTADEGAAPSPQPSRQMQPEAEQPPPAPTRPSMPLRQNMAGRAVRQLHARWAAEEAMLRRSQPGFSLQKELQHPEMRRLMSLPGMRMADAYRLAHYNDAMQRTAQAVEQGVVERIRQRSARPAENGTNPGPAAAAGPDVSRMTRTQREELERKALHGARIEL